MPNSIFWSSLFACLLLTKTLYGSRFDWYSYYIQCVATSSQEVQCYDAIREYLSTEEGRRQAEEVGFKRQLFRDSSQVASQAVVISNRIHQMESYLVGALEKAKEENDTIRMYCINEKNVQMGVLRKNVEEKKSQLLVRFSEASSPAIEEDYQLLLSLNSRANELYMQAKKCFE